MYYFPIFTVTALYSVLCSDQPHPLPLPHCPQQPPLLQHQDEAEDHEQEQELLGQEIILWFRLNQCTETERYLRGYNLSPHCPLLCHL